MEYKLWQNAWKDNPSYQVALDLPEEWQAELHEMAGDRWPALDDQALRQAVLEPLGMPPIREMAQGKKSAAIVFDDMTRPTPAWRFLPVILEELQAAGVPQEEIRFLCAVGTYGPLNRKETVQKLGEDIVENYPVYSHNCYEHCVKIGVNSRGDDVLVDAEFMRCEMRIGIGCVAPHPINGYSGGGKLLFPGMAHIDTTEKNHRRREFLTPGDTALCGLRRDIDEMTRMTGPFFLIDVVMNAKLDVVGAFAGDPFQVYQQAAALSAQANRMELGEPKDIVITNANAKFNEAFIAVKIARKELKPGGNIVIVNHCPTGPVVHYLYGSPGKDVSGRCPLPRGQKLPDGGRVICWSPYPVKNPQQWDVQWAKTWPDVLALLRERHPGPAQVSILSDGSIGYWG